MKIRYETLNKQLQESNGLDGDIDASVNKYCFKTFTFFIITNIIISSLFMVLEVDMSQIQFLQFNVLQEISPNTNTMTKLYEF